MKLEGQSIYTLNDNDIFFFYQDLWKTKTERENAAFQGIQTEAVRKIRINAGDKGTAAKDVAIGTAYGNWFCIPLDLELLSSHNPFFQYELKDRLSYELTFNNYGKVIVSTDSEATYTVSDIHLEFETITSLELATMIKKKTKTKTKKTNKRANLPSHTTELFDIPSKHYINQTRSGTSVWPLKLNQ